MKYIIREIPCCRCCPLYEYGKNEGYHMCTELNKTLQISEYTIDPMCPLPKTRQEAADRR